ncbi:hypothetical protein Slala05_81000 [Streptomyces lavendulae subsp. lavendulae]|nr:hypothetical protein Slala05_81000 [Streptomyces lavendulae subsp. lavendulae]
MLAVGPRAPLAVRPVLTGQGVEDSGSRHITPVAPHPLAALVREAIEAHHASEIHQQAHARQAAEREAIRRRLTDWPAGKSALRGAQSP